jgi:predicted GNAT family N-acyltransferase
MTTGVHRAETASEREDALAVRYEVFVEEQGVPEELEADGKDDEAVHFVGYAEGDCDEHDRNELDRDGPDNGDPDRDDPSPVSAGRLRPLGDGVAKVERIAVLEPHRGEGWGRKVMTELEATAEERGIEKLIMHAQTPVEGFYRELGCETTSDVFEEAGIEHVEMEKSAGRLRTDS